MVISCCWAIFLKHNVPVLTFNTIYSKVSQHISYLKRNLFRWLSNDWCRNEMNTKIIDGLQICSSSQRKEVFFVILEFVWKLMLVEKINDTGYNFMLKGKYSWYLMYWCHMKITFFTYCSSVIDTATTV